MPNQLTATCNVTLSDSSGNRLGMSPPQYLGEPDAFGALQGVWKVGTSPEAMPVTDLVTPFVVALKNLDDTNDVDIGFDDGGYVGPLRLFANGPPMLISMKPGDTLYGMSTAGTVNVQFFVSDS